MLLLFQQFSQSSRSILSVPFSKAFTSGSLSKIQSFSLSWLVRMLVTPSWILKDMAVMPRSICVTRSMSNRMRSMVHSSPVTAVIYLASSSMSPA